MFKRLAVALTLSTLLLSLTWRDLLSASVSVKYFHSGSGIMSSAEFVALMANTLVLTSLWLAGATSAWRSRRKPAFIVSHLTFILMCLQALNNIRVQFADLSLTDLSLGWQVVSGLVVLLFGLTVIARMGLRPLSKFFVTLLLILSPLPVILLAQLGWHSATGNMVIREAAAPFLPAAEVHTPRILWLVFDEFDQRMAFEGRAPDLDLPELDRLRGESLYASNAYPPAGQTLNSMPALITGRLVSKAEPTADGALSLTFAGQSKSEGWGAQPNVFSMARALGRDTGLIGWYHPYCRLIGHTLSFCYTDQPLSLSLGRKPPATALNVLESMQTQVRAILWNFPLLRRASGWLGVAPSTGAREEERLQLAQAHRSEYLRILEEAKKRVVDPRLGLLLIHWPVPHPPGLFSRARNDFKVDGKSGYLDNLALVDRTLGEIRGELERAGVWDQTTIIITSDHWWRVRMWEAEHGAWAEEDAAASAGGEDRRVPFLVKLASHNEGVSYETPFNAVISHDLIRALLRSELSNPEAVATWLDRHRSAIEPIESDKR